MTKTLSILPAIVGLLLVLFGYHFAALELKVIGGVSLGWATLIHAKNIRICRELWDKNRTII